MAIAQLLAMLHEHFFLHLFLQWFVQCLYPHRFSMYYHCESFANGWSYECHERPRHACKFRTNSMHLIQHKPRKEDFVSRLVDLKEEMGVPWKQRRLNWHWDFDRPHRISFVNKSVLVEHRRRHQYQLETRILDRLWWSFLVWHRRTSDAKGRGQPFYVVRSNQSHVRNHASEQDWSYI